MSRGILKRMGLFEISVESKTDYMVTIKLFKKTTLAFKFVS